MKLKSELPARYTSAELSAVKGPDSIWCQVIWLARLLLPLRCRLPRRQIPGRDSASAPLVFTPSSSTHIMSNFGGDAFDGATAIGDNNGPAMFATNSGNSNKKPSSPTGKSGMVAPTNGIDAAKLDWVDSSAYLNTKRPFCVKIGSKGGVRGALEELNAELKAAGLPGIISKKRPHQLIGREGRTMGDSRILLAHFC